MRFVNKYTHTSPIVFHAPGASRRSKVWTELQKEAPEFCKTLRQENDPRIAVITWNTDTTESILEQCLSAMDHPVTVLGRGKADWCNRDKTKLALDAIADLDADYIIGLDAWDVALTAHPKTIVDKFETYCSALYRMPSTEILFNGSPKPWPLHRKEPALENTISRAYSQDGIARHLNAGCWIGRTPEVLRFLSYIEILLPEIFKTEHRKNEQPYVKFAAEKRKTTVAVDRFCDIFHHCRTEGLTRVE